MKAILKFDLNDADDRLSHKQCVKANDMAIVLWHLVWNRRKEIENEIENNNEADKYTAIYLWHERLTELLDEHSIDVDELCV